MSCTNPRLRVLVHNNMSGQFYIMSRMSDITQGVCSSILYRQVSQRPFNSACLQLRNYLLSQISLSYAPNESRYLSISLATNYKQGVRDSRRLQPDHQPPDKYRHDEPADPEFPCMLQLAAVARTKPIVPSAYG